MSRVLVIAPAWVGDVVMTHALIKLLHRENPNAQIDLLCPSWLSSIAKRMPAINTVIDMPIKHGELKLKTRYQIGKTLREKKYDRAIIVPTSLK